HHLRRVQGHRQHGDPPGSEAHGQARVPVDRCAEERHTKGRAAHPEGGSEPDLGASQGAQSAVPCRGDGAPHRQDVEDEIERRLPSVYAEVELASLTTKDTEGTKDTKETNDGDYQSSTEWPVPRRWRRCHGGGLERESVSDW